MARQIIEPYHKYRKWDDAMYQKWHSVILSLTDWSRLSTSTEINKINEWCIGRFSFGHIHDINISYGLISVAAFKEPLDLTCFLFKYQLQNQKQK